MAIDRKEVVGEDAGDEEAHVGDALVVAEAMLFVDYQQAQIAEVHALLEDAVGADDDVDFAAGETFAHHARLGGSAEAREGLD